VKSRQILSRDVTQYVGYSTSVSRKLLCHR